MEDRAAAWFSLTESKVVNEGARIGKVTRIDNEGNVWVALPGLEQPEIAARVTTGGMQSLRQGEAAGRDVLLAFENNDPGLPIIVDTMHSLLDEIISSKDVVADIGAPEDVLVDGRRITFEGREEVVLRCGKSSITLTRAGKVLIRGAYLLSRSSGVNRIKGGSVQIN